MAGVRPRIADVTASSLAQRSRHPADKSRGYPKNATAVGETADAVGVQPAAGVAWPQRRQEEQKRHRGVARQSRRDEDGATANGGVRANGPGGVGGGVGDLVALDVSGRIESGLDGAQVGSVVCAEAISSSLLSRRSAPLAPAPSAARLCREPRASG
jgi:hypothetical protein